MFVSRKRLSRRTVLRGIGTAVALPFLEAMVPAMTALAQSVAQPPLRFGGVYVPNGATMDHWMPTSDAPRLELSRILSPLESVREHVVVINNLSRAGGTSVTDHAVSSAGWLSGAVARQTEAEDIYVGISIDQVLAADVGRETRFPSLEFATEDFTGYIGGCVPGYSCTYMNTISWASPTAPLPMEINPRVAFERMFGRAGSPADRVERVREDQSILDSVTEEIGELGSRVGAADRNRLDDYLENVREIERRIQRTSSEESGDSALLMDAPVGIPETFEEHIGLMFDLLAVAWESDLTRVFTFMTGREASQRTYPVLGIRETHHDISHHGGQQEKKNLHAEINSHFVRQFANFVERLRTTPEGDGSLLDHSLIAYGGGMSDGQAHNSYPLPLALVGSAGGRIRGDRFIVAPEWTPVANLWLTVAEMFGSRIDNIGESNGRVDL